MADFDSSLPVRTENAGDVIAKIADASVPSQQLAVNSDGSVNITDNGGSLTVDGSVTVTATDLDIRDLSASQDNVAISDGTDTLEINADGSINSVVSATDLDIRDLTHVSDSVRVGDGTEFLAINADGSINITDNGASITVDGSVTVSATDLDIRDLSAAQDNVAISDGTDSLEINADGSLNAVVSATDLDIRDLTHVTDSVKIGDGTDFLAVNADGSINVVFDEDPGTEVIDYNTAASVAGGGSSNHDYTTAAAAKLYQVYASASGKLKIEVQIETGAATNTFNTVAVGFNSTANPNIDIDLRKFAAVANGARIRVVRTNRDNQAQDVYSTIIAVEI